MIYLPVVAVVAIQKRKRIDKYKIQNHTRPVRSQKKNSKSQEKVQENTDRKTGKKCKKLRRSKERLKYFNF